MITTHAQLLIKEFANHTDVAANDYIRYIVEGTAHMRELISDLLTFTEIRAGGDIPGETVDLNKVIESVKLNLKTSFEEAHAVIAIDPLPAIRAHETSFRVSFSEPPLKRH